MTSGVPHPRDRAQSWADCDADLRRYVEQALAATGLEPSGVYVHGSLAMGCFYRAKSDVDLLVVVREALTPGQRERAARALAERAVKRPILGDLELSVLTERQAAEGKREFEVHYSAYWTEKILAGEYAGPGRDPDLAAHVSVVRQRGVVVSGRPAVDVFGEVSDEDYLGAIEADLRDVDLVAEPYYGVLNACRVLMVRESSQVVSKEEGGEWGIRSLPDEHRPVVEQALRCYRSARPVQANERGTDGHGWDVKALESFRKYVD
ncbi:aminoglycoside adenylyltransferase domain-containing protein [Kribbella italica]|uniref:Streptomycin 3'-adenylyltransferase n=1 Tax=Kribbella italica TaxID=1540520 RepID=A0A7W9MYL8_9ACTN|nr:aminoglycoside adenylyltransferase domain-containing protein [Kribbella italica]MBB5841291.1 streptomycin 3'-adenylyltransferase [Kribbella italica]